MDSNDQEVKQGNRKVTPINTVVTGFVFLGLPIMVMNSMIALASYESDGVNFTLIICSLLLAAGYFYPTIAALKRRHANRLLIAFFNLFGFLLVVANEIIGEIAFTIPVAVVCWSLALIQVAMKEKSKVVENRVMKIFAVLVMGFTLFIFVLLPIWTDYNMSKGHVYPPSAAKERLKNLVVCVESFYADHNHYPTTLDELDTEWCIEQLGAPYASTLDYKIQGEEYQVSIYWDESGDGWVVNEENHYTSTRIKP